MSQLLVYLYLKIFNGPDFLPRQADADDAKLDERLSVGCSSRHWDWTWEESGNMALGEKIVLGEKLSCRNSGKDLPAKACH